MYGVQDGVWSHLGGGCIAGKKDPQRGLAAGLLLALLTLVTEHATPADTDTDYHVPVCVCLFVPIPRHIPH